MTDKAGGDIDQDKENRKNRWESQYRGSKGNRERRRSRNK